MPTKRKEIKPPDYMVSMWTKVNTLTTMTQEDKEIAVMCWRSFKRNGLPIEVQLPSGRIIKFIDDNNAEVTDYDEVND